MPETLAKKFAVNVLTPDAFKSIPKGSGNLLSTFDLSAPKIDSTNVVCATQGGVTISYSNSMEDTLADIDNAPTNTKQGNEVTGTTATIAFTTPNASPDVLKLAIGTADIDADDPTHVVPRIEAALKDYRELYWVGPMIGGGFLVCKIFNALSSGGLSLKTGAFLAVDGTLIAVFAVKYTAAENVDWALHALKRSRITPVLAVRDGSITPALLKRKFGTDARAVYPTISTRLALSEKDGEHPYALLYREGLMPYAEIAVGSKRLVHAVRMAAALSLGSSAVSALLAFYLTFVGAYSALTPVSMLLYLLLWALAALIEGFWADRY